VNQFRRRTATPFACAGLLLAAACSSVAAVPDASLQPPLDAAVLVTGSFGGPESTVVREDESTFGADMPAELQPFVDALASARVFHRTGLDPQASVNARAGTWAVPGAGRDQYLQRVRDEGYDWLLVVEGLRDGPIESQGVNGRWPITLGTWLLVGLGFLIPDHGFESRAILRVSLRDLESGRVLYESLVNAGPVELSLVERTGPLGLLTSVVVPPFWVADDEAKVRRSVRGITMQRLLQFASRELKSPTARQRLRDGAVAVLELDAQAEAQRLRITSRQAVAVVRLRHPGFDSQGAAQVAFEQAVLGSMRIEDGMFRYEAPVPVSFQGVFQVVVSTIEGEVVSATFDKAGGR